MIMKQPELGRKISVLRQEKNMTQEELVEACNVSVRTIQRIESGEVTPRVSTVKIIIAALGESMDFIYQLPDRTKSVRNIESTETWLQAAWVCGIVAFILGFIDTGIELARNGTGSPNMSMALYLSVKMGGLISYIVFYMGLIKLGDFFENHLLSIACYLQIALSFFMTSADIISLYYEGSIMSWVTIGTGLMMGFGAAGVVLGVGLLRLQDSMGQTAKAAGVLEIVGGICLVTVLLFILGLLIYLPAMILEIVLLYKAYEYVKAERVKN